MNVAIVAVILGCQQGLSSRRDPGNFCAESEKLISRELTSWVCITSCWMGHCCNKVHIDVWVSCNVPLL